MKNKNSGEIFFFVVIVVCIYFILALFGSSLTGEGGQNLGNHLRNTAGGPVIVLILFVIYLAFAKLMSFRVPKIRRQFFGTLTLYFSFAFLLGLLKESGWTSQLTLLTAGSFGTGLAHFFVLNAGTFVTLILVTGAFLLSAVFFGSKLPKFPKLRRVPRRRRTPPGKILVPSLRGDVSRSETGGLKGGESFAGGFAFPVPKLKPAPEPAPAPAPEPEKKASTVMSNAVEMIDNALALIDSGQLKAPVAKVSPPKRAKKTRRPLPVVSITPSSDVHDELPEKGPEQSAFPPPPELFGPKKRPEASNALKNSEKLAKVLTSTLKTFGLSASVAHIVTGPSFTQFQLELAPGTKVGRIMGLSDELTMLLGAGPVRIEAPIPGTRYVGVEVPCSDRRIVTLREVIDSEAYRLTQARLPLPLGLSVDGSVTVVGLEELGHLLVAGETGSGRSTFVNASILSMCSKRGPEELRLILIDQRHVEFAVYDGLPHLLAAPLSDADSAVKALMWAYDEMDRRTAAFARERVRNLAAFNRKQKNLAPLPEIAIVIGELSDLLYSSSTETEGVLMRLAQKAASSGIYLLLSAQRPSPDVFTTMIKTNIAARAVFSLTSEAESKNIIGTTDATRLTGKGDMLFRAGGGVVRYQAPLVREDKISEFVEYMFSNFEPPETMKF